MGMHRAVHMHAWATRSGCRCPHRTQLRPNSAQHQHQHPHHDAFACPVTGADAIDAGTDAGDGGSDAAGGDGAAVDGLACLERPLSLPFSPTLSTGAVRCGDTRIDDVEREEECVLALAPCPRG